jgi:hypothetical protein
MKQRITTQAIASLAAWLLAFSSVASQNVLASALSRKSSERFAASQIGTDPVAPLLAFGGMPLTVGVSPYLFAATQTAGGGGIGVTYGDRTQRQTNNQSGTSAAASTIGATNGSINIAAGNNVLITGSNVLTGTLNCNAHSPQSHTS